MSTSWAISVTLAALLASQVAMNAPSKRSKKLAAPSKPRKTRRFETLDSDKNGVLTRTEFLAGSIGKAATAKLDDFEKIDTDDSGGIDLEEFRKFRPPPLTPQQRAKRFQRLDRDGNGKLTLEEDLAGWITDKNKRLARMHFMHWDTNRDNVLSLEEFQYHDKGVQLTPSQDFTMRDQNGDGKLNEVEFMRPNLGNRWEAHIRRNLAKFDLDGDHFLSLSEFKLIPHQHPDAKASFEGLDTDHNGQLDRREFIRITPENQILLARQLFDESDANHDAVLDESEYRAYTKALAWAGWKSRFWSRAEQWGWLILIVLDAALVVYIVHGTRQILKAKHRQRSLLASRTQFGETPAAPPMTSTDDTPSQSPLDAPESLDAFQIE